MRSSTAKFTASLAAATLVVGLSAVAVAQSDRSAVDPAAVPPDEEDKMSGLPPGGDALPPPSAGELLAERSRQLDAREAEIEQARKDLAAAEKALEAKISKLEALIAERTRVEKKILTEKEKEAEAKIARTTEVTGKMPPESAAAYLSEMSVSVAAKILSQMKSRKAAAIMAAMLPSKAAEISRMYLQSGNSSRTPRPTEAGGGAAQP